MALLNTFPTSNAACKLHACTFSVLPNVLTCSGYVILDLQIVSWSTALSFSISCPHTTVQCYFTIWEKMLLRSNATVSKWCYKQQPHKQKWSGWRWQYNYISNHSDSYLITTFVITIVLRFLSVPSFSHTLWHLSPDLKGLVWIEMNI